MKTTRDVLCVIRYFQPDWTPYRRALVSCWTRTKRALRHEIVLTASFLLWTTRCGRWLVGLPVEKCAGFARTAAVFRERAAPDRRTGPPGDETDGDGVRCEVLYDPGPGSALMDVVFIHGLRGDKLKTWKQGVWKQQVGQRPEPVVVRSCGGGGGRRAGLSAAIDRLRLDRLATNEHIKEFTDCWPRDWLPLDCPYVRVIAISYSTDPYLWRPIWLRKPVRTTMKDRGLEMISLLKDVHVGHNPITWVGHSKGGLFIKQILVHDTRDIQKLQETFQEMMNCNRQVQVKSFIETKLTLMKLIYLRIVSIQSADPGFGDLYGVPLDHRNICKPKNRNCFLYQELVNMIHSLKQSTIEEAA